MVKYLRIHDVCAATGWSRSQIYSAIHRYNFPRPVKLGRSSAWPSDEVEAWLAQRRAARDVMLGKQGSVT